MIQVETSVVILRPIEAVFAFASDVRNNPLWQMGIAPISLETAPSDETKTRTKHHHASAPPSVKSGAEILSVEPNHRLALKIFSGPFEFESVYHFEPADAGTRIIWTCRFQANGQYRFTEALIGQAITLETGVSLAILKNLLKARPPAGNDERQV